MSKRQLPVSALDAIARVLTSDQLQPLNPSPQIFALGGASTYGIRTDYRARRVEGVLAPARRPRVHAIAEDIARALGAELVDVTERWGERLERIDEESPTTLRNTVIVCDDLLQRVNDPGAVLMRLRSLAADGSVVVLSAPLRSLADGSLGPPEHASVAREWTFPELQACLDQFDFEPLFGGVLATDVHSLAVGVIVAAVRLQRDQS